MELERLRDAFETAFARHAPPRTQAFHGVETYLHGGKRLRPLLCLSLAEARNVFDQALLPAVILEYFHAFTLIHDDIEDNSPMRRGKPALHVTHGIAHAINAGDALYTHVHALLHKARGEGLPDALITAFLTAFHNVVEGQALEIAWRNKTLRDVTEEDYMRVARLKTGVLLGLSLACPLILTGEKEDTIKAVQEVGEELGIAFQIIDDYLNIFGEDEKYGKEWADDLTEGKITLLIIHTYHALQGTDRDAFEYAFTRRARTREEKDFIIRFMRAAKADHTAKRIAQERATRALHHLHKHITLPPLTYSLLERITTRTY